MIRQYSNLNVADNTGAKIIEVIQVYGKKRVAHVGGVALASVKSAIPNGQVKKKDKVRIVIARQKSPIHRSNGITVRFDDNAAILINADGTPRGTRIIGPVAQELREKGYQKIVSLAPEVL